MKNEKQPEPQLPAKLPDEEPEQVSGGDVTSANIVGYAGSSVCAPSYQINNHESA